MNQQSHKLDLLLIKVNKLYLELNQDINSIIYLWDIHLQMYLDHLKKDH